MKELKSHKVNGLNDALTIQASKHGPGGAHHRYVISGGDERKMSVRDFVHCEITFQDGPIMEVGVNGVSNEALLAIVIDRLQGFQSGDYRCRENAIALTKIEEAMHWLHARTRDREALGIEGTMGTRDCEG